MAYFVIEDFKIGLDKRRLPAATPAGALITLQNGHINRGGEIEKAKKFVSKYTLPAGTFGLSALGTSLYVFGSAADPGVPYGVTYQRLQHEAAAAMSELMTWDIFAGQIFATARYANADRRAFYNATIIAGLQAGSGTDFDGLVISSAALTYKNKVYLTSGTNLLFSAGGDASEFDEMVTGSGLIDFSVHVSNEAELNGLAAYQNYLAVLSTQNIAIWQTDPDPASYELIQVLPNLGTNAPRSVVSFGDYDIFFLSDTGVRSLRAVNSSLSAGVSDVGTPIDDLIVAHMDTLSPEVIRTACAILEPKDGRYLLSLGDTIYVFSFFQASKISAWSTWSPGFNITDFVTLAGRLYGRSGNTIYLLGGDDNDEYTDQEVIVEMPFLDARTLATWKEWEGLDVICEGAWRVDVNSNPNKHGDPAAWTTVANLTENTTDKAMIGLDQYGPVLQFRFVHQGEGDAKLSKVIIHYKADRYTP